MCQPALNRTLIGGYIMENPLIIGVMGGGMADPRDAKAAYRLGSLIAEQGWILLNAILKRKCCFGRKRPKK